MRAEEEGPHHYLSFNVGGLAGQFTLPLSTDSTPFHPSERFSPVSSRGERVQTRAVGTPAALAAARAVADAVSSDCHLRLYVPDDASVQHLLVPATGFRPGRTSTDHIFSDVVAACTLLLCITPPPCTGGELMLSLGPSDYDVLSDTALDVGDGFLYRNDCTLAGRCPGDGELPLVPQELVAFTVWVTRKGGPGVLVLSFPFELCAEPPHYGLSIEKVREVGGFLNDSVNHALKTKSTWMPMSDTLVLRRSLRSDSLLLELMLSDWSSFSFDTAYRVLNELDVPREYSDAHQHAIKFFCTPWDSGDGDASSDGSKASPVYSALRPLHEPAWFSMSLSPDCSLVGSPVLREKPTASLAVFGIARLTSNRWGYDNTDPEGDWARGIAVEKTASTITIKQLTCMKPDADCPAGWSLTTLPEYMLEYDRVMETHGKPAEFVIWSGAATQANSVFAAGYLIEAMLTMLAPVRWGNVAANVLKNGLIVYLNLGGVAAKYSKHGTHKTIENLSRCTIRHGPLKMFPTFYSGGLAEEAMAEVEEGRVVYEQNVERARGLARVWTEINMPY